MVLGDRGKPGVGSGEVSWWGWGGKGCERNGRGGLWRPEGWVVSRGGGEGGGQ